MDAPHQFEFRKDQTLAEAAEQLAEDEISSRQC